MKNDSTIRLKNRGSMTAITVPFLDKQKVARVGFTTRRGGVSGGKVCGANLSFRVEDEEGAVVENRRWAARLLGVPFGSMTFCGQAHGDEIAVVGKKDKGRGLFSYREAFTGRDAMITNLPGITLCILIADCLPLVLIDTERRAVGAAHLGWKGTALKLAIKTALRMGQEYACNLAKLTALLGPSICPQCYEVDPSFKDKIPDGAKFIKRIGVKRYSFDLKAANKAQLLEAGIRQENIIDTDLCTAKYLDYFYSHRAEGVPTGRQMAAVLLR